MTRRYYYLAMVLVIAFVLLFSYTLRGQQDGEDDNYTEEYDQPISVAERLMAHFDLDENGLIDRDEAQIDEKLAAVFSILDTDGDGSLTMDELLLYRQSDSEQEYLD